jgi:hypothetical protein
VNSVVSNQVGKAFVRRLGPRKRALEVAEPLGEQGPAHSGDPTMDLVEAAGTDHQLANDQGGPTVTEHVDPDGDRALLRAAHHGPIVSPDGATG